jgi:hypothetical protein
MGPFSATRARDFAHFSSIDVPFLALARSHSQSRAC